MMDKVIKQKLSTHKAPFHEPDWHAMEKLLDQKTKKPLILPWWKSGIAAAFLLVSTITFGIYQNAKNAHSNNIGILASYQDRQNSKASFAEKMQTSSNQNYLQSLSNEPVASATINNNLTPSLANKKQNKQTIKAYKQSTNNIEVSSNNSQNPTAFVKQEEFNSLLPMNILIATNEESNFNSSKAEEVKLVHKSRKLVQYTVSADVGAMANIKLENTTSSKSFNVYSDVFSDAGLNFQCLFINKIGCYTGIKYADRKSYSQPDSMSIGAANVLLNSKSKIEGINIPIGIIANIYDQKYCNIYTKVGLNNIIPIKETIDYQTVDVTTEPPVEKNTTIGNTKFIASTDNNVSLDKQNVSYSVATPSNNNPENHTIKQKSKEKYLAELQFALGLKIKANSHLAFSFEPAYQLDLKNKNRPTNGSNFSLSTGILYSF